MSSPQGERPAPAAVAARVRRIFCSSVLVGEALVVVFAVLVAKDLSDVSNRTLLIGGGAFAVVAILVAGSLSRPGAYAVGGVLQGLLIASGFVLPAMFVVGAIFLALWITCLVLARRVERIQAGFAR